MQSNPASIGTCISVRKTVCNTLLLEEVRQKQCIKCAVELTDNTICFSRSIILNRLCSVAVLEDLQEQEASAAWGRGGGSIRFKTQCTNYVQE